MADLISRLKLESGEFDSKIKRAGQELLAYSEHCKKMGLEMGYANRDAKEFAKALGSMQTVSQTARGKINELSEAFINAKVMYKNMTDAEKQGQFGKNLASSLDQLKARLNDAKKDLADVQKELNDGNSKFGQFGSVIDTLGQKLGLTTNATELLTSKTALMYAGVGAGIAVVTKATEAWASYNSELSKQDQVTQVTTGLRGPSADRMTDIARAMVDTYNVDFREVINAANTLMTQFGKSGDEAMQLIKDGMRGMIQGDGPKLLSMIQQFAPSFRDAGISASQLVAIIHNSEGGIFTDQNMNAIVMGIKNIRLMTKATSDALAKLGIDGQEMTRKLNDGTLTIFQAMQQVTEAIQRTGTGTLAVGEVMQYVFGRQGVAAGTNLGKAIATLNTNLEETKRQTGELGDAFADLQTANEKLNTAIREAFGYDGWEQMAKGIESKLVKVLATVIEQLGKIRKWFHDFTPEGQTENIQTAEQKDMNRRLTYVRSGSNKQYWHQQNKEYYDQQVSERQFKVSALRGDDAITKGLRQKAEADLQAWKNLRDEYNKKANDILSAPPKKTPQAGTTNPVTPTVTTKTTGTNPVKQAAEKVASAQHEYAQSIELAKMKLDNGTKTEADYKKQLLSAEERLWNALGDAYETHKDPKYKQAQDECAAKIKQLGGEVTASAEAQKKAQDAARELESAQKKLADAQKELANAQASGDLKQIYAAEKKAETAQQAVTQSSTITVKVEGKEALEQLQKLEGIQTVKVNVEEGKVNLPKVPTDDQTIKVNVEQGNVNLPQVPTDDQTVKVNVVVDNAEAIQSIQQLEGVTIDVPVNYKPQGGNLQPVEIPLTTANIDAFTSHIKEELANAGLGSSAALSLQEGLSDATAIGTILQTAIQNGIDTAQFDTSGLMKRLINHEDISDKDIQAYVDQLNNLLKAKFDETEWPKVLVEFNVDTNSINRMTNDMKEDASKTANAWNMASRAISGIGSALNQIEDPSEKILATVLQGIANVVQGAGTATSKAAGQSRHWTEYLAAAAAITAQMITTVSQIHSITGYASGGVVKGNSFSGDNVGPVMLDAGELILNRSQQNVLAEQLTVSEHQDGPTEPYVTGEMLYLGLNNYLKRSGKGEIVTSKRG